MLRVVQQLLLTAFFAVFATQASAMFIQPDWFEVTQPGVGTNRYAYNPSGGWGAVGASPADGSVYRSSDYLHNWRSVEPNYTRYNGLP